MSVLPQKETTKGVILHWCISSDIHGYFLNLAPHFSSHSNFVTIDKEHIYHNFNIFTQYLPTYL